VHAYLIFLRISIGKDWILESTGLSNTGFVVYTITIFGHMVFSPGRKKDKRNLSLNYDVIQI
jgi:hypothetical protein